MLRLTLLVVVLLSGYVVTSQPKSKQLVLAESTEAFDPVQSINLARRVFGIGIKQKDYYNTTLASLFLSSSYRKLGNYNSAVFYDSVAVLYSSQQTDWQLQQKATNSYTRNFVDQLQLAKAENLLAGSEALLCSRKSSETCVWYEMKALCYFNRLRFDSAILTCRTAITIAQQLPDSTSVMHLQMLKGKMYVMKLRPDSIYLVHNALNYFFNKKEYRYAAQAANIIGFNLETVNSPDKAMQYYDKALAWYRIINDAREIAQTRMNMGDAYLAKKDPGTAKVFFDNGYQYFTTANYQKGIAGASIRLGKLYSEANQYDSAWYYFKIVEKINNRLQLQALKLMLKGLEGQLLTRQKDFEKGNSLFEEATEMALKSKDEMPVSTIEQRLLDEKIVSPKEIAKHNRFTASRSNGSKREVASVQSDNYQRVEKINWHTGGNDKSDSTNLEKGRRQALQIEADNNIPVLKDSLQTERNNKNSAWQEVKKHQQIALLTIVALVIVAGGMWVQYKSRRRAERDRAQIAELQAEIHHRVTNNLGVINAMVEMAAKATTTQMPAAALKTRIDSIALVHRLLYSGTASIGKVFLQPYFEALSKGIAAIFEMNKPVKITIDAPIEADSVLAEKLGLVVNELITNSFKYAFTTTENASIHLYARQHKGELYLTVADNGGGLPVEAKKGYGSKLIKGLCHQLKGQYSYENKGGTFFEMTVPV